MDQPVFRRFVRERISIVVLGSLVGLTTTTVATTAHADIEDWTVFEYRLPVLRQPKPQFGRMDWRFLSELRLAGRYNGIEQIYFRTGPLAWLTNWMFVGTHISVWGLGQANSMLPAGNYQLQTEVRWDLEPNFFGRIGPFTVNSRNRIEYRWFNTAPAMWRFRSQLRVNLAPQGWVVMPFVMDEPLFDLNLGQGFYQNRAHIGVGFQVLPNVRIDVAYMNRARWVPSNSTWDDDHAAWINVFVDVPVTPPASLGPTPNTPPNSTTTPAAVGPTPQPANSSAPSSAPTNTPSGANGAPGTLDTPPTANPSALTTTDSQQIH